MQRRTRGSAPPSPIHRFGERKIELVYACSGPGSKVPARWEVCRRHPDCFHCSYISFCGAICSSSTDACTEHRDYCEEHSRVQCRVLALGWRQRTLAPVRDLIAFVHRTRCGVSHKFCERDRLQRFGRLWLRDVVLARHWWL